MSDFLTAVRERVCVDVGRIRSLGVERVPDDEPSPSGLALPDAVEAFPAEQRVLPQGGVIKFIKKSQFFTAVDAVFLFFVQKDDTAHVTPAVFLFWMFCFIALFLLSLQGSEMVLRGRVAVFM